MEKISNISLPPSGIATELEQTLRWSRSYAARVAEIITKARAGTHQQLDCDEMQLAVASWLEVLENYVPETRLNDCYVKAIQTRSSNFPLGASELCTAWNSIREAEMHSTPHRDMSKQLAGDVCQSCWGTGYEIIKRGKFNYAKSCEHREY